MKPRLKSDLVVDKALRLGLIDPEQEAAAREMANWDITWFCDAIGQDHKEFIRGLWGSVDEKIDYLLERLEKLEWEVGSLPHP